MNIKNHELEDTYQRMPPLSDTEYNELKEDIREHGVHVPVIFDLEGRCIDGHHRLQICRELGINEVPSQTVPDLSEQEKIDLSRTLNLARRHLTQEQRQKILQDQLSETPEKSDRQIGEQLGVDHKTVGAARKKMESTGEIPQLEKTVGADGRARAKSKPAPVPEDDQTEEADDQEEVTNEDTDVEDAGISDDEDHGEEADDEGEERDLPACCQAIHNGFQGLFGLIDIEVRKLHESGKFDLYSGDIILELQDDMAELQTRLSDVRNGRSKS